MNVNEPLWNHCGAPDSHGQPDLLLRYVNVSFQMLSRFDQLLVTCVQPSTERNSMNSRNSFVAVTSSIHMSAYDHTSMGAERCLLANTIATTVQTVWRINRWLLCANCQNALGMIQNGTEAAGKLSIITPPFTSMTISPWLCIFLRIGFWGGGGV